MDLISCGGCPAGRSSRRSRRRTPASLADLETAQRDRLLVVPLDVTHSPAVRAAIAPTVERFGRPDYQAAGKAPAAMHTTEQLAANDTDKVARLVVELIKLDEPPLRLLVGPEAYAYATAAGRAQLTQGEHWRELSESTVADDATPHQIDPMRVLGNAGYSTGEGIPAVSMIVPTKLILV